MTRSLRRVLLVVAAAAMSSAYAQHKPSKLVTVNEAQEVAASAITLPATESGLAVFATCAGCPAKGFPASAATKYYLNRTPVKLADLRAAILTTPDAVLTVKYSVRNGQLVSISAPVAPTSAAPRRTP